MKLNIILDSRRVEKYQPLMDELSRQGITDYALYPCIILPNVVQSINASHKMIVEQARDEGLKEVCIAEDDLFFPAPGGWEYFLKKKPSEYQLYLGGCYSAIGVFMDVPTNTFRYIVQNPVGFHLYCIHECYYDEFLSTDPSKHIDTAQEGIFDVCYPFAALQRPGFSINNMKVVDYNYVLKEEDVYGGLPKI